MTLKQVCPQCRDPLPPRSQLLLNGYVQREIQGLKIKCVHIKSGCLWEGTLGTDQRHLLSHLTHACVYHTVSCLACKQDVLRVHAARHPESCPSLTVFCGECRKEMTYSDYIKHQIYSKLLASPPCSGTSLCTHGCLSESGKPLALPHDIMLIHESKCRRGLYTCPHCQVSIKSTEQDIQEHCLRDCWSRWVRCRHCLAEMPYYTLMLHYQDEHAGSSRGSQGSQGLQQQQQPQQSQQSPVA